jgi:hypothetical protein
MLSLSVVQEIERLLAEGQLSRRRIAARLGVGKSSVAAIASGKRANWGRESKRVAAVGPTLQRCPSCGVRVTMPCVACAARRYQRRRILALVSARSTQCDNLSAPASAIGSCDRVA